MVHKLEPTKPISMGNGGNGDESDPLLDVGKLMRALARVEGTGLATGARVTSLQLEHERLARETTQLTRDVADLLESSRAQLRLLQRLGRFAPALIVVVQIIAAILRQLQILK